MIIGVSASLGLGFGVNGSTNLGPGGCSGTFGLGTSSLSIL